MGSVNELSAQTRRSRRIYQHATVLSRTPSRQSTFTVQSGLQPMERYYLSTSRLWASFALIVRPKYLGSGVLLATSWLRGQVRVHYLSVLVAKDITIQILVQFSHLRSMTICGGPACLLDKLLVPGLCEISIEFRKSSWAAVYHTGQLYAIAF